MNSQLFAETKTRDGVQPAVDARSVATAAWHALLWLVIANAAGVLLAILLLAPGLNGLLGEWTMADG